MTYKSNIRNSFDKGAESYDAFACVQKQVGQQLLNHLCSFHFLNSKSIVDLGSGTGFMTGLLQEYLPDAEYILNDISPRMLEIAGAKFIEHHNVKVLLGDAENTTFASTDLIISNLAFQWFEDLERTMEALWKKTGILAFSTLLEDTFIEWEQRYKNLGLLSARHKYPTAAELESLCVRFSPKQHFFSTKKYYLEFVDPLSFVRYLRKLGASVPCSNHHQRGLRQVLKKTEKFSTQYDVFFAILVK